MRPLKARGKEWVHGLSSGSGSALPSSNVSRLGRPSRSAPGVGGGGMDNEEDVDSDGSDLVRSSGSCL